MPTISIYIQGGLVWESGRFQSNVYNSMGVASPKMREALIFVQRFTHKSYNFQGASLRIREAWHLCRDFRSKHGLAAQTGSVLITSDESLVVPCYLGIQQNQADDQDDREGYQCDQRHRHQERTLASLAVVVLGVLVTEVRDDLIRFKKTWIIMFYIEVLAVSFLPFIWYDLSQQQCFTIISCYNFKNSLEQE